MNATWKCWLAGLALALGCAFPAAAQQTAWRAVPQTTTAPAVIASTPVAPVAQLGRPTIARTAPAATLAAPAAVVRGAMPEEAPFPPPTPQLQVVSYDPLLGSDSFGPPQPPPPSPFSTSRTGGPPDSVPPPGSVPISPPDVIPHAAVDRPIGPTWGEKWGKWFAWGDASSGNPRGAWCSDPCVSGLVSPVTMPFFFEDPRALTEVRPIFMYQSIPSRTPNVGGGDVWFFGTQARLAFNDRFSIVMNELGFIGTNPKSQLGPLNDSTGFAEVKIGPKYTFFKSADSGSVAAAGLTFELPVGSNKVYQNVGTLSMTPYLSYGQTFGRLPSGYGSLNFMGTTGYSFSIDNERSQFYYLNLHLDYNVANMNTFFPLVELNWIRYTRAGNANNFGFEGADLINFGSATRQGRDYVSVAGGLRYRFNDHVWAGAAVEFPVSNEKGLSDYRLTFDVIFRY